MSIDFDRNRAQVLYESFIGVTNPDDLNSKSKKDDFKLHRLTENEAQLLNSALQEDALDFFFNGTISFAEGIISILNRRFSWATIKLYYSVYYLIRASLCLKGYAILRCKGMYRLKSSAGETPYNTNNKKYSTTHEGTINHYIDIYSNSDLLLSNHIEDLNAYQWIMNAREIVNYRSRAFLEPDYLDIWTFYSDCLDDGTLIQELNKLQQDNYVKCFQEEYAIVAIPIKRMQQTLFDLNEAGILSKLSIERDSFIRSIIDYDNNPLMILNSIFSAD